MVEHIKSWSDYECQDELDNTIKSDNNTDQKNTDNNEENNEPNQNNNKIETFSSFDDMNLKEDLLRGIYAYGFEKPSTIQQRAIVPLAQGYDIIGQSQSGTGKTGTFSIGTLQRIDPNKKYCQALLLSPTRELASQTHKVISSISDYLNINCFNCIGGTKVSDDISILKKGVHIVVGTPGRVFDMINRKVLNVSLAKKYGWKAKHNLRKSIQKTYKEFIKEI